MSKEKVFETKTIRSQGALIHLFKEQGQESWKMHNWDGPAIEPIEDDSTLKKAYYLYGLELAEQDWTQARKDREGLPWYKNPSMRGTTRF
jgi:hypothetical protein